MAIVNTDVVTRFAFQGSIEPLTKYNATLSNSIKFIAASTVAISASMTAFTVWIQGISKANDALGQMSRTTGVSVEVMGELGYAALQNGSNIGAITSSMSALSQKIGEASLKGSEDFARLGISIYDTSGRLKTADKVFLDFQKRVHQLKLSQQQTQDFASKLGIDQSLVQLLSKSSSEMDELRKKAIALGRVTTAQSDSMLAYNDTVATMGFALDNLKAQIAVAVIPQLQELARTFTQWVVANADKVVAAFKGIVEFGKALMDSVKRMSPLLLTLAAGLLVVKVATMGLAGAMKALSAIPVIALITGVYLVIDDLITAFDGGKSVISGFYKDLFDRDVVEDLKTAFKFINENVLAPTINGFKQLWEIVKSVWEVLSKVGSAMSSFGGAVLNFAGIGGDQSAQMQPSAKQLMSSGGGTSSSSSTVNQNVTIDVKSNDPVRAGQEVVNQLNQQTESAYYQAGRGAR